MRSRGERERERRKEKGAYDFAKTRKCAYLICGLILH
jgi:hypothetical protein